MALTPRAKAALKLLALVALLGGAWLALQATPAREYFTREGAGRLVASIRQTRWAPLAFVVAYVFACALDFSGLVLTLAGGALFGFWWGAVLNTIGANLGATAAFWVARALGREGVRALVGSRLAGLDRLAEAQGFLWLLRLRLIPVVPFNLLNFGAGLTAMPWRQFAGATAIGIFPGTLVYTFFATALLSGSQAAGREAFVRVAVAGALLIVLSFLPTIARRLGWLAVLLLALWPAAGAAAQSLPDHAALTEILREHVHDGRVDYAALQRDSARLDAYLAELGAADSAALAADGRTVRLAFWIDAYNACMLARVLAHYPIRKAGFPRSLRLALAGRPANSVWQIPGVFTRKRCRVAGALRSQDDIEHGIMRPMGDPRVHFALNCAARSCPVLADEAYVPDRLDDQLDAAVRRFMASPSQFLLSDSVLYLNKVLDWYKGDFAGEGGLLDFFARYADAETSAAFRTPHAAIRIRFFDYDWTLNDVGAPPSPVRQSDSPPVRPR